MKPEPTRLLFIALGFISLIIGILGILLPLVPGTPFLILAAYCFQKGSDRFHSWLIHHRWLGRPIREWEQSRILRLRYKWIATFLMASTFFVLYLSGLAPPAVILSYSVGSIIVLAFVWMQKHK